MVFPRDIDPRVPVERGRLSNGVKTAAVEREGPQRPSSMHFLR
jgi:hypothetical protein